MKPVKSLLPTWFIFFFLHSSLSLDTIRPNLPIKDGDVVVSNRERFALGFFSPGNSKSRYVGIWYYRISEQTVVWVANRDNPINDNSGTLAIDDRGNLMVYRKNGTAPVWSMNTPLLTTKRSSVAQLLDSGNLLLLDNVTGELLWQSFDHPTHCMLPLMKLGLTRSTGTNRFLISWKSPDDPGTGNYSYRIKPDGFPQLLLYKGSSPLWRTGSWTGQKWSGVPEMTRSYIFNVSFVNTPDEIFVMYGVTNDSIITRMVVNETGMQQRFTWNPRDGGWIGFWSAPKEQCDYYGYCGPNSNCDPSQTEKFECTCLPGFKPKSPQEWFLRDGSGGCVRNPGVSTCRSGEGFVRLSRVKVPDTSLARADMNLGLKECERRCLSNCSCVAFSSAYYEINGGKGCLTWHGDLLDARTYPATGQDFYVRVDAVELAQWRENGSLGKKKIIAVVVACVAAMFVATGSVYCLVRRKIREKRRMTNIPFSFTTSSAYFDDTEKELEGSRQNRDLPFFDFTTIAKSTNNFSIDNKLGEGGFGSVYKGVLENGKEIAVKRLSKHSGQGVDEFKNEITLIAKLQHRNLVRILGCCIEGSEKMLIYEYLPNKSLDSLIFDETKGSLLDWSKRFEIICGVARGILYLHQDSRLRIIHRDLKASNVLLDASLSPKISDFGMARIFGGDQTEGNTKRVVGTYGYMSPEYAMEGLFSIKSDVYSFGVLLLEIISGLKNSSYYSESRAANLVGHVWDLWKEGRAMEIVGKSIRECSRYMEVLRCIQIGLLCVQEHATDRPTMSTVVFMLGNDAAALPAPKHPAFILKNKKPGDDGSSSQGAGSSVNEVTLTLIHGR